MIEQRSAAYPVNRAPCKWYGVPFAARLVIPWSKLAVMLSLSTSVLNATAQSNDPLGPLFFNPAERRAIVQERTGPAEQEKPPSTVTLSGVLFRSGGKGTAWINGQAVADGQSPYPGMPVTIRPGHISIRKQVVRPGETLDLTDNQRVDMLAAGAVTRR